ncbi:hypothetical protein PVL29_000204 [Vitis rotundifolia]|uniref:Insecticidal crystal toxin domain-containing protein n=1 Tax=Vitis rotundifolia TaxID=103349 RepID=A0AA39AI27_VITRO|nr:hypothetical protein PVL29_000204 [Vitis rotundifolia]
MYVTRPLSLYRKSPEALSLPPPEGPNSGYLILQDEESETYCCFGLCKESDIRDLPFPQNKNLTVRYSTGAGQHRHTSHDEVIFIPVLNQPLSLNRYYAIKRRGRHKGVAHASSREEDMSTCCFCNVVNDVKPRPLDPQDIYQQFEISLVEGTCTPKGSFTAKSIAPDGFPPNFLRREGWNLSTSTPRNFELGEAAGLDPSLRARLPDFNFPLHSKRSEPIVVGKWYCPFMFVKDGELKDQAKRSVYYEMTLEQKWEQIFACENSYNEGNNTVAVDVVVQGEVVAVAGGETVHDERNVVDGVMWFRSSSGASVGLRLDIIERMKWEQVRAGWDGEKKKEVRVERAEEYGGTGGWRKFGCYVLVETFVLKRMDGSLVLSHGFKHTHQIKCRWE